MLNFNEIVGEFVLTCMIKWAAQSCRNMTYFFYHSLKIPTIDILRWKIYDPIMYLKMKWVDPF